MEVRNNLLPNKSNLDVLNMLKSTLWCPDIFPEEAIEKLKAKHPRVFNLKELLNRAEDRPDPADQGTGSTIQDQHDE